MAGQSHITLLNVKATGNPHPLGSELCHLDIWKCDNEKNQQHWNCWYLQYIFSLCTNVGFVLTGNPFCFLSLTWYSPLSGLFRACNDTADRISCKRITDLWVLIISLVARLFSSEMHNLIALSPYHLSLLLLFSSGGRARTRLFFSSLFSFFPLYVCLQILSKVRKEPEPDHKETFNCKQHSVWKT